MGYTDSSATIEWTFNSGWEENGNSYYYDYLVNNSAELTNGDKFKISSGAAVTAAICAQDESGTQWMSYYIDFTPAKASLSGGEYWAGEAVSLYSEALSNDTPVTDVKSSDSSVMKVKKGSTLNKTLLTAKKAGKCKITATVKINGEKKKISGTYTVLKYPNAMKALKVGGKKVNFKKNPDMYVVKGSKAKTKLEFKTAKGWKFESGTCITNKTVKVKNGSTVKIPKGENAVVYLNLVNSKKERFQYEVFLQR